ncbi:hypothetical protein ORI89_17450 [Sphingobacterium sp. UT-1RO-CII-1]|uniref:hypothetical protein n=1 Tax=Sphingobacterium sp. UT-1RO-CII-1 TaxID=2995225 RepID=UPI00227A6AC9|nr:hypothetical protein [Sphingobacterium sp. UT-1RO-CII-1]MCY4781449.1 hypothetical protein [Sphingobacterium sp. UT-1RO-CII-1]
MGKVLLQSAASEGSFGDLIGTLLMIGFIVLLFIVFRNIVLWYYKLDIIAKNIEEQTQVQKAILRRLEALEDGKDKQDHS